VSAVPTEQALRDNQLRWDDLVPHHVASAHYGLREFLLGGDCLTPIELAEVGDVAGKRLLHTQCHFGMDTLCWARRGARVTGVDFSPKAIDTARRIATRLVLDARFEVAEVSALQPVLGEGTYDVVFTSWGVLTWLPDLDAWARSLVGQLAPGGVFYLVDVHPIVWTLDPQGEPDPASRGRSFDYFRRERTHSVEGGGSYAAPDIETPHAREHFWTYELGQVVTALLEAGLQLEFLHEHDAVHLQALPELVQGDDRLWRLPPGTKDLPLSFSVRGRRAG
jgi:SAM-dependent methyltransferase